MPVFSLLMQIISVHHILRNPQNTKAALALILAAIKKNHAPFLIILNCSVLALNHFDPWAQSRENDAAATWLQNYNLSPLNFAVESAASRSWWSAGVSALLPYGDNLEKNP